METRRELGRVKFGKDLWDRRKNWPIADQHLPSNDLRNNCALPVPFSILKWRINWLLAIGRLVTQNSLQWFDLTTKQQLPSEQFPMPDVIFFKSANNMDLLGKLSIKWPESTSECIDKSRLFYFASLQVIQSLSICPRLVGFVMNILAKLITKQVKVVPLITFRYMTLIFWKLCFSSSQ